MKTDDRPFHRRDAENAEDKLTTVILSEAKDPYSQHTFSDKVGILRFAQDDNLE